VARSTAKDANVAGRTEGDSDLELLLVKDKDNLIAKVGRISAPVVMDLLAVVLGESNLMGQEATKLLSGTWSTWLTPSSSRIGHQTVPILAAL
jgi:hypothetical protein